MMQVRVLAKSFWWLIHKDLRREFRAQSVWPCMLLLGIVLVFLLTFQLDLAAEEQSRVVSGLLWLAIFFAGTLAFDHSFVSEQQNGAWQSLTLYPIDPAILFLAKMAVNLLSLFILEAALIPTFIIFSEVQLLAEPIRILPIVAFGSVGLAALGTLVSALTANLRYRGGLVALLLLPLVTPIVLGSAEATRMTLSGQFDWEWWQWIQLLGVFAVVFTVTGVLVFEFVMEE
jgi:heme exporter protein B